MDVGVALTDVTMSRGLRTSEDGPLVLIEMTTPAKRNSLDLSSISGLIGLLSMTPPPDRRMYLIYGAGSVFCAGADRKSIDPASDTSAAMFAAFDELYHRMAEQPLPISCWINGPAIGAGAILTMLCDIRLVSRSAWLAIPGTNYGLALAPWLVEVIAREVGQPAARLLLLGNARLEAERLLGSGFALGVASAIDEAVDQVLGLARAAPLVMKAHRRALQGNHEVAAGHYEQARASLDLKEGFAASRESRPPAFEGR